MRFTVRWGYQCYLFMNSKHHKSDVFQVTIQLLVVTAREIYMRTQAVCTTHLNVERWQIKCHLYCHYYICGYYLWYANNKRCWKLKILNMLSLNIYMPCAHCLCSHIYVSCSHQKQLNGDSKGILLGCLLFMNK